MAVANDSIVITPGSGATVATHSPAGSNTTEYQVQVLANAAGQLVDSMPTYGLNIPQLLLAVDEYHWELFNHPSSGKTLVVRGIWASPELSVGNIVLSPERWDLFRTTAVGSGGTASAAFESTTTTQANFFRLDTNDTSLSSHISCRTTLTSITTGTFLFPMYVSSQCSDTAKMPMINCQNQLVQGINWVAQREFGKELGVAAGTGIALRQRDTVASGRMGWLIEFTVDP